MPRRHYRIVKCGVRRHGTRLQGDEGRVGSLVCGHGGDQRVQPGVDLQSVGGDNRCKAAWEVSQFATVILSLWLSIAVTTRLFPLFSNQTFWELTLLRNLTVAAAVEVMVRKPVDGE
jgi:hypothetical protein